MQLNDLRPFANEPFKDFADPDTLRLMKQALADVRSQLGQNYVPSLATHTAATFSSLNPARPAELIGTHTAATADDALAALDAAEAAFPAWSRTPVKTRVQLLLRAAQLIRERHFVFCAWLTLEVGKNYAEADADVGECIDFLEFYARQMLHLDAATTPIQFPGERNRLRHVPLGPGVVIPPWNFPFAIMAGMTTAAIVCGNTIVLKPSPDAPTIAAQFVALLVEAGLPPDVVTLIQGGAEPGRALTESAKTRFIAFTGSKKVGLEIHERAARVQSGQRFIKRTILELGGKDGIIVAADADIALAVEGVAASAFGFNGQKCSACSRVIVDAAIYEDFCARLTTRVAAIQSGDPADNAYAGPVINAVAQKRVLDYIATGKTEGRLLTGGHAINNEGGHYIEPTVIADVAPDARIAQEEIFGPLLAVIRARDFNHALAIANDTEYGLTGAIYSRSRDNLDRAAAEFQVGNLYLNRKCTGAMVGAHPFGGFKMSGTDSKAGGADYLTLFTQAKSIAEKVGPAPPVAEREESGPGL
jgi:1-pyrroline-5-carboxylate dehydrogenase